MEIASTTRSYNKKLWESRAQLAPTRDLYQNREHSSLLQQEAIDTLPN
ncbi:MAG: hypothetical protein OXI63_01380 [Candidatus Poribacteria bacterium]|nr:hypothetical protein [Candidatus Poribacteria bacterium]